jgi:cysteine desulfuration protein SufE
MSIEENQNEIIEEFAMLDAWEDKYEYIIDLGKKLPPMPEAQKTDTTKIKGCQSQVWVHADYQDGKVNLNGDSDAMIVRGLVAMVLRVLDGQSPKDIAQADLYFPTKIGMDKHLAATRSNGLASMIKQVKLYGLALSMQERGNN